MPIDPQSGLDPETGMMGLKETRQPTGAIGAVMSYLNADKSRQISEALQQHRAASAQMAQQQADEYQARQMRDDQVRQALAKLGPGASQQDVIGTYIRNSGDVERVLPWMRAQTSAGAKVDAARVKAGTEFAITRMKLGDSPTDVITSMSATYSPEEMDEIKKTLSSQPLPVPEAKAAKDTAEAGLAGEKTTDLTATRPSRIALNKARAETDRLIAQASVERAKRSDGSLQPSTRLAMEGKVALLGKWINEAMEKTDQYTFKKGPSDMTQVDDWKKQKKRLEQVLMADGWGGDDEEAPPPPPAGSKSPFKPGTFDTNPAGGDATTSPGGTSSPQTVDANIKLPVLPPKK